MKKLMIILFSLSLIATNAYAYGLSNWAEESFNNMSSYGILTADVVGKNLQDNITRTEFCQMLMNMYKCDKRVVLTDKDMNVFDDSDNQSVLEAYKVGIVSGKGERLFAANDPITRQEMAVMLSRTLSIVSPEYNKYEGQLTKYHSQFSDSSKTAEWALSDMSAICDYEIITGNDLGETKPLDNASREQAICMLDRVYKRFIKNTSIHTVPKFKTVDKKAIFEGQISLSWQSIAGAKEYYVIIKTDNNENLVMTLSDETRSVNEMNNSLRGFNNYTIILGVRKTDETQIFSKPTNIDKRVSKETENADEPQFKPQLIKPDIQEEVKEEPVEKAPIHEEEPPKYNNELIHSTDSSALNDKKLRVFPDGIAFETKEVAEEYMVEVEVPAWRLHSDGTKTSYTAYIEVNKELAQDVISIFTEIYNDGAQFPIKDVGGFCWRNTSGGRVSQHSYGTCIDINYNENYYVEPDGTPITGELWLPGENPFSIAPDSIVVKTFAKYGWLWGGTAWSDKYAKDYMHFTYLGN